MIKKSFAICLAFCILFVLTGCQLALEDAGAANNSDRLIGIFITDEYLDLFDMEGYLNDNINKMSGGGEIHIDGNNSRYQGRLYATIAARTLTNEETGQTVETKEFLFDSVEGIPYFCAAVPAAENENSFIKTGSDVAISDGHTGLYIGDEEDKTTLEGTIYVIPDSYNSTYFINPVYQSADGSVYAVSGSGMTFSGESGEGQVFNQKLEETAAVTENGKSKSVSISIDISLAVMLPPEKVVLLQMDQDSSVLSQTEYRPGELPTKLEPEPGTEFIIAETYKHDLMGNPVVTRSLFDESNETMETFYSRDDGICVKQWTQLDWTGNEQQ